MTRVQVLIGSGTSSGTDCCWVGLNRLTVTLRSGAGLGSGQKVLDQIGCRLTYGQVQVGLQVTSFTPLSGYRLGSDHCRFRSSSRVGSVFDSSRPY